MQNVDVVQWIAFVVLTLLTLGGAIMVVADRNLFHGALWLLVSLFGVAGFFVMLAAPFLAAVQVLVYMGAIVILIIFAIMLTQRMMGAREAVNNRWPIGLVMSALAFLLVSFILTLAANSPLLANATTTATAGGTGVGRLFFCGRRFGSCSGLSSHFSDVSQPPFGGRRKRRLAQVITRY